MSTVRRQVTVAGLRCTRAQIVSRDRAMTARSEGRFESATASDGKPDLFKSVDELL